MPKMCSHQAVRSIKANAVKLSGNKAVIQELTTNVPSKLSAYLDKPASASTSGFCAMSMLSAAFITKNAAMRTNSM